MPRPSATVTEKKSGGNPFTAWFTRRKERKLEAAEEAAKKITNDTAKNENLIIDTLSSVDFLHSRLPEEVLNQKSDENRPYCDLDYAKRALIQLLSRNSFTANTDIRKIDEKLLTICYWFKQSVEQGDARAAYAAKAALLRGIKDIRMRIPFNQPELSTQFVETNAKYLDTWISLIGMCQLADRTQVSLRDENAKLMQNEEEAKRAEDELYDQLMDDAIAKTNFAQMLAHDTPEERANWTPEQRDMHRRMIERRLMTTKLGLNKTMVVQLEQSIAATEGKIDILNQKLALLPIVCDPNLMEKYKESVDELFLEMARSDVEFDEALQSFDDIDGRIKQLDVAPGAVRAREVAVESAEQALEEIKKRQEIDSGEVRLKADEAMRGLGILSREELLVKQAEVQKQEQEVIDSIMEQIEDTEQTLNYN